jgi:hypothetical protein
MIDEWPRAQTGSLDSQQRKQIFSFEDLAIARFIISYKSKKWLFVNNDDDLHSNYILKTEHQFEHKWRHQCSWVWVKVIVLTDLYAMALAGGINNPGNHLLSQ